MKELFSLFFAFAKIGAMTFGGGAAMLPMLQRELVENRGWVTEEEIVDYYAVGQCTPGIIAINTATFVGYKKRGVLGSIFSTAGMVFPSLVIILLLAHLISAASSIAWVQHAFAGIRACVSVLVINSVINLAKKSVIDFATTAIFVLVFACSVIFDLSPVWYVLAAAAAGIALRAVSRRKGGQA